MKSYCKLRDLRILHLLAAMDQLVISQ